MRRAFILSAVPTAVLTAIAAERIAALRIDIDPTSSMSWAIWLDARPMSRLTEPMLQTVGSLPTQIAVVLAVTAVAVSFARDARIGFILNHLAAVYLVSAIVLRNWPDLAGRIAYATHFQLSWRLSLAEMSTLAASFMACAYTHLALLRHRGRRD